MATLRKIQRLVYFLDVDYDISCGGPFKCISYCTTPVFGAASIPDSARRFRSAASESRQPNFPIKSRRTECRIRTDERIELLRKLLLARRAQRQPDRAPANSQTASAATIITIPTGLGGHGAAPSLCPAQSERPLRAPAYERADEIRSNTALALSHSRSKRISRLRGEGCRDPDVRNGHIMELK